MRRAERPLLQLPVPLIWGFLLVLSIQLLFHHYSPLSREYRYQPLSSPLQASTYRGVAMGSEKLMGYLLALRLQLHDSQAGRYFSYNRIDYAV